VELGVLFFVVTLAWVLGHGSLLLRWGEACEQHAKVLTQLTVLHVQ
jgi:hypothetical protein